MISWHSLRSICVKSHVHNESLSQTFDGIRTDFINRDELLSGILSIGIQLFFNKVNSPEEKNIQKSIAEVVEKRVAMIGLGADKTKEETRAITYSAW